MKEEADVIFSWYSANEQLIETLKLLERPYKHIQMRPEGYEAQRFEWGANMLRGYLMKTYGPNFRPLRTCVLGFSQGCSGVLQALLSSDAKFIDAAIAIDGPFARYWPDSNKTKVDTSTLAPWKAFSKLAIEDGRLSIMTASSIVDPFKPPVELCVDWIWQNTAEPLIEELIKSREQENQPTEDLVSDAVPSNIWLGPVEPPYIEPKGCLPKTNICYERTEYFQYPTKQYRQWNGFTAINYANLDKTGIADHRLQAARVMPLLIKDFLVNRWNKNAPSSGIILSA